jgi:hypothetical protein
MSLVSEALRKARQEGRLRDGKRWGVPTTSPALPGGGRPRFSTLAVVGLASLGSVVGAAVVYLLLAGPRRDTSIAPALPTANPRPTIAAGLASVPAGSGLSSRPRPAAGTPAVEARPDAVAGPYKVDTLPSAVAAATSGSEVAATGASRRSGEPRSGLEEKAYVIDADLGYAKLHLDFLVYKPSAPFASVNGQQVVPGSLVSGFRVDEIGVDAVRLSDSRTRVVLHVR